MVPGYLLEEVFDPTGAGIASPAVSSDISPNKVFDLKNGARGKEGVEPRRDLWLRVGSFCCEKFGVDRFRSLLALNRRPLPRVQGLHGILKRSRIELALLLAALIAVSAASTWFVSRSGWTLYYGDAEAHLNIARRVLDSRTPATTRLGRRGYRCRWH